MPQRQPTVLPQVEPSGLHPEQESDTETLRRMERTAWVALWSSFALFCLLAVSLPLSARWVLENATRDHSAQFTPTAGTPVIYIPGGGTAVGQVEVREGYTIRTDPGSQGALDFNPFINATVSLFSSTEVEVQAVRSPRFGYSTRPDQVVIRQLGGTTKVDIGTVGSPLSWTVDSLHGPFRLAADGSYLIEVNNEQAEVVVRSGLAEMANPVESLTVLPDSRGLLSRSGAARLLSASRNLIVNSGFREGLAGWGAAFCQGVPCTLESGGVEVVAEAGRLAARYVRTGAVGVHGENRLSQEIQREVSQAQSLVLRIDLKLAHQSLEGCGVLSSECPLMARILYRDQYGSVGEWLMGFYYRNPGPYQVNPAFQQVLPGVWISYQSPNLLEELDFPPVLVDRIEVYASGHDYESYVSNVQLIIE